MNVHFTMCCGCNMFKGFIRCILVLWILCIIHRTSGNARIVVPEVTFEVYTPNGFKASIPDAPGVHLFVFEGKVDKEKKSFTIHQIGTLRGWGFEKTNGRLVFSDPARLELGDVINYYVYVNNDRDGLRENLSFTVSEIVCQPSVTRVHGKGTCPGETIFEDDFSQDSLREDIWQKEQYIPIAHPEYPFVSYQRSRVTVSEGCLRITPELQNLMPGFNYESIDSGTLNLYDGCTSSLDACVRNAPIPDVMPPVASGRVSTRNFAFTYGTVYIRAKLPQGHWIYPEILLMPFLEKYGKGRYASGVIKIATARGNERFPVGTDEYGNKVLYGGPVMDFQCRQELLSNKTFPGEGMWGDDFHEYSINWSPDIITLLVDGEEWARVDTKGGALHERFPQQCSQLSRGLLENGTLLAPFDEYFYLTLGVAVGGITEFLDTGDDTKPWVNTKRKAMKHFWEASTRWYGSWYLRELVVDYVRVVALNETTFVSKLTD